MSEQATTEMSLRERLLRIPIFYKILIANSAIVVFGAIAGTIITVWYVAGFFSTLEYGLIALFAAAGMIISFVVNNWVLKRALEPLDRLQSAVDEVRRGDTNVRVDLGANSDERFDRLADTFNQMLDALDTNSQRMQKLSRMILTAQEEERHRLARDLHDEEAQALSSLLVHLRLLERAGTAEEAQQRVHELRELTALALEDVRRVAVDLRPTILDDLGLAPALEWRVDEFNKTDDVKAFFSAGGLDERLPRDMELVLYRIGQEALNNIGRHAHASTVQVTLIQTESDIILAVADDGDGFDPMAVEVDAQHGLGLEGMRERIGMIGGEFAIESALGQGTRIEATAPLPTQQHFGATNGENPRPVG
jgi:two-component system sensor histidine kinase UhpB